MKYLLFWLLGIALTLAIGLSQVTVSPLTVLSFTGLPVAAQESEATPEPSLEPPLPEATENPEPDPRTDSFIVEPRPDESGTPNPASSSTNPTEGSPSDALQKPSPTAPNPQAPSSAVPGLSSDRSSSPNSLLLEPVPIGNTYTDPQGKFQIGILAGYTLSPLGHSVLIEAPDGSLAYTVVVQAIQSIVNEPLEESALSQLAQVVFQRGEGFQLGLVTRDLQGTGFQMAWAGNLTIAGQTQPMGGTILTRQNHQEVLYHQEVLFLIIAATRKGEENLAGAIATLSESFQLLGGL